ncbi:unnamed protein product [Ilex paraguariensis]|uniref:SHSP domain-containing protein n=1 Tax=Ilex paraguariensis TaxID=185542 RepID=A0ABC8TXQ0_9AQUA
MGEKPSAAITERVYEELEPSTEWVEEEDWYTLLVYVSGFKIQQLKVERDNTNQNLIISGERPLDQANNKWIHFKKQFQVSTNCDTEKISARFDRDMLYIKLPKLITRAAKQDQEKSSSEAPEPQKPENDKPQPQKNEQEQVGQKTASMADTNGTSNGSQDTSKEVADKGKGSVDHKMSEGFLEEKSYRGYSRAPKKVKNRGTGTSQDQNMGEDKKMPRNTSANYENGSINDGARRERGDSGKKDYGDRATLEGAKLRMSRRMMNMVLIILLSFVLGLYLTNLIRFWKKDEN